MGHARQLLTLFLAVSSCSLISVEGDEPPSRAKAPNGVYAVLRESVQEKDVLPVNAGEVMVVHRHRYLKSDETEPPRYLVIRSTPDVQLELARKAEAVKQGEQVLRILLKLQPQAAAALERLTSDRLGQQIAIVLGGEVVTMHKIREVIKGGDVQITSCTAGAANYLLEQLEGQQQRR